MRLRSLFGILENIDEQMFGEEIENIRFPVFFNFNLLVRIQRLIIAVLFGKKQTFTYQLIDIPEVDIVVKFDSEEVERVKFKHDD